MAKIQIIKANSYQSVSEMAKEIVIEAVYKKPNLVLGLPTGSTPLGLYDLLIKSFTEGRVDFSNVVTFNLDEYCGLKKTDPQSYYYFMQENLFSKINIKKENIHILDGMAKNYIEECDKYEEEIRRVGGIDLQILGIGKNGHIGFNEPGSLKDSRTRLINLDKQTVEDNARFFSSKNKVPKAALTMGIGTILESKKIILLAGKEKKETIGKVLSRSISPDIPASYLKLHNNCTFIVEE